LASEDASKYENSVYEIYLKLGAASFHNSKNSFYWKCCQEVKTITCTIPDLQKMNLEKNPTSFC
jgi:hypothetical protein